MLDVYERRTGNFEIVDTDMIEIRSKRMLYYRLIRFVILLLAAVIITLIIITVITVNLLWLFAVVMPIGLGVLAYRNLLVLRERLDTQISSIVLEYDKKKHLKAFKVRRWREAKLDEYMEEDIRHNQAIGFKVIWYDDGFLDVMLLVDPDFPGTKVFETPAFYSIAELRVILELALPELDQWYFNYEDGSEWTEDEKEGLVEEMESVSIPFIIRDYFSEL